MSRYRSLLLGAIAAFLVPAGRALVMTSEWVLTADTGMRFGYDSNFAEAHVPVDDFILTGSQNFLLRRRGGTTHFSVDANLNAMRFFDHRDEDSLDGGVTVTCAFPADDSFSGLQPGERRTADTYIAPPNNTDPSRTVLRTSWTSRTDADRNIGQRVQSKRLEVSAQNNWYVAPKLLWSNSATFAHTDFTEAGLNPNSAVTFDTSVLHDWRTDARWGGEYEVELGSSSDQTNHAAQHMLIHSLSLAIDGVLLPKVYGRASAGISMARYTGYAADSQTGPRFGLGLTWQQSPLSEVHLDGGYDYGFSADGSAVVRTSVTLTLIRKIARGYTLELAMTPARTVNRIVPVNRTDNELRTSATVTYQFTERFDAAITSRWSWITSDDAQHALRRIETFASLTCHY